MINVGIIGISGYSGKLILKILLNHPNIRITYIAAGTTQGALGDIHPEFLGKTRLVCKPFNLKKAVSSADFFFVAVPHTHAMEIVPKLLLAKKRVIDLSADYRFPSQKDYQAHYHIAHKDIKNLSKAVYGLPELYREDIRKANLVANPGCYPTGAILALAPLVSVHAKAIDRIFIDAKSGVSGAGRKAALELMYAEVNENLKAYKILSHQHAPEIDFYLSKFSGAKINAAFVPHLIPMNQGIFETIYISLTTPLNIDKIETLYQKFYKTENFVRVLTHGKQPEIKYVVNTNYCDIGFSVSEKTLVLTCAIDNLMKGASGQAVQNMNIMCGFKEDQGLC